MRRFATASAVAGLAVALASLVAPSAARAASHDGPAVVHPALWPRVHPVLPPDPALERRVRTLLAHMTLREKVGQLIQADITTIKPEDLLTYPIGSVLAGGNSGPYGDEFAPPAKWRKLVDAFHRAALARPAKGHAPIPLLFGIDAVHGNNNVVGATLFPQNSALGATRDPALVRAIGAATADEVRAIDVDWTFAPTVAVPQNSRWGRTYEGFSQDPRLVAELGAAEVEGLQGMPRGKHFLGPRHVVATAKHFLGDGGTYEGHDQGDARVSEKTLRDVHAAGYVAAIGAGVQTIMVSFSSWNGVKMTGNHALLTDVLKKRMGFDGFLIGDWNAHGQLAGCTDASCAKAYNAGMDMLMAPQDWRALFKNTLTQVKSGEIPMARLDDAVTRILRVKMRAGLFDHQASDADTIPLSVLGSPKHRALARRAVRESLVLLKNRGSILPINPHETIGVAGNGADSISQQSGGWTITWQGTGVTRAQFPHAQSIWSGIQQQVKAAGGHAELSEDGQFKHKPDVAIVVFGEHPYAEFQGDLRNFAFDPGDDADLKLLKRLRAQGIPVVSVFLAGRPLWVNREINASDAFVMAWLPGSEGGGVADVLLRKRDGAIQYDFHGKLPYAWPRTAVQVAQTATDPQYPYGFGLTYADHDAGGPLPEASGLDGQQYPVGVYLQRGRPVGPTSLTIADAGAVAQTVKAVPAATPSGDVSIRGVDYRHQEDAREVTWQGRGGSLAVVADKPLDLTRETNGDVMLVVTLRADQVPAHGKVSLGMDCAGSCGRIDIPFRKTLASLPAHTWTSVALPLKCFRQAGASVEALRAPFVIDARAPLKLAVAEVKLGSAADRVLACPAP